MKACLFFFTFLLVHKYFFGSCGRQSSEQEHGRTGDSKVERSLVLIHGSRDFHCLAKRQPPKSRATVLFPPLLGKSSVVNRPDLFPAVAIGWVSVVGTGEDESFLSGCSVCALAR